MSVLKRSTCLLLMACLQLLACAHQPPVQTGVYFFKTYVTGIDKSELILADFTFEMTATVCELVVSAKGVNESFLCSTKGQRSDHVSVYFNAYRSTGDASLFGYKSLTIGEKLFSLSFEQGEYVL